jgi:hypothetical protein
MGHALGTMGIWIVLKLNMKNSNYKERNESIATAVEWSCRKTTTRFVAGVLV